MILWLSSRNLTRKLRITQHKSNQVLVILEACGHLYHMPLQVLVPVHLILPIGLRRGWRKWMITCMESKIMWFNPSSQAIIKQKIASWTTLQIFTIMVEKHLWLCQPKKKHMKWRTKYLKWYLKLKAKWLIKSKILWPQRRLQLTCLVMDLKKSKMNSTNVNDN